MCKAEEKEGDRSVGLATAVKPMNGEFVLQPLVGGGDFIPHPVGSIFVQPAVLPGRLSVDCSDSPSARPASGKGHDEGLDPAAKAHGVNRFWPVGQGL